MNKPQMLSVKLYRELCLSRGIAPDMSLVYRGVAILADSEQAREWAKRKIERKKES